VSRISRIACLALVACFSAAPAFAGKVAKIDLTAYLDGHPQQGDFRVYARDDGASVMAQVLQAVELPKSTVFESQYDEDGQTEVDVNELVHGKEARVGTIALEPDIALVIAKPKKVESFVFVPGKPQKYKLGFKILYQGQKAGKATLAGFTTFVGFVMAVPGAGQVFGDFNPTPLGTMPVAQFHREQTLTFKVGKDTFGTSSVSDYWVTLERGTVRREYMAQSFENGVPTSTFGPYVYTLDHGEEAGVPFP